MLDVQLMTAYALIILSLLFPLLGGAGGAAVCGQMSATHGTAAEIAKANAGVGGASADLSSGAEAATPTDASSCCGHRDNLPKQASEPVNGSCGDMACCAVIAVCDRPTVAVSVLPVVESQPGQNVLLCGQWFISPPVPPPRIL